MVYLEIAPLSIETYHRFKHSTNYSNESASALTNSEETTDSITSNMLSNLSCLVSGRSSVMIKIKYAFY
jgi:hypothetical protein